MFVSCVCCVLCIGLCVEPITGSERSFWMLCVCLLACDLETSTRRRSKPDLGCCSTEQKYYNYRLHYKHSEEPPRFCGRIR